MQGQAGQARLAGWPQKIEEAAHGRAGTFDYQPLDVQKAIETVHLLAKQKISQSIENFEHKPCKILQTCNSRNRRLVLVHCGHIPNVCRWCLGTQ